MEQKNDLHHLHGVQTHLRVSRPVYFQNGAILVEFHSCARPPVEDVGSQNALDERCEAVSGAHSVQLLQQVRQNSQGRSIFPVFVMAASHSMSVMTAAGSSPLSQVALTGLS